MNRLVIAFASLGLLATTACRGSSGDDTVTPDSPVSGSMHIQDIQNDSMAAGTPVTLKGVIVTAIDTYGTKTGDMWIEEPAGGPFSGVHVFGVPLATVATLAVGDIVDLDGAQKDEFTYMGSNGVGGDTSGRSVTELKPLSGGMITVTKTGVGTVPAPVTVDALAIGQKATQAERDAEWEKWEGVLIKVTNVSANSGAACVGTACSDNTLNKFDITGGAVVESSLAAFPGFSAGPPVVPGTVAKGDCLASVTGVVDYFFDYLLLNTSTANVATGGTGCPVAEGASHAVCSDGIDNDGNSFADCADNGCIVGDAACRTSATITEVQTTTPTGPIELQNVYVTGISFNKKNLWVATSLTAAPNEGIYVFRGTASSLPVLDASIVVGAKVNVIGKVTEFNNDATGDTLTEISGLAVTFVAAPTTAPVPVTTQTAATLLQTATGEPYEGVLVTLTNVKVTTIGTSANSFNTDVSQKVAATQTPFKADDDMYRFVTADLNKCYATVTGIWSYSTFNNAYIFLPRTNGAAIDGVEAASTAVCN